MMAMDDMLQNLILGLKPARNSYYGTKPVDFDPEAGLVLSRSFVQGAIAEDLSAYWNFNTVFAADVTFPAAPQDGVLFEHGGGGTGIAVLLRNGGTVLRLRAGDGANPHDATSTALLNLTDFPKDNQVHTVIWDVRVTAPGRVRLWIDGVLSGEAMTTGGALESNRWTGGGSGGFATGQNMNMPGEIPPVPWPAAVIGGLRMYSDQLVTAGS